MKKINNLYYWNCLGEWAKAQQQGLVQSLKWNRGAFGRMTAEGLLWMAEKNCYPGSLLCLRREEMNYLVLSGPEQELFDFIQNKIPFPGKRSEAVYFSDFSPERKKAILAAQVESVWLRMTKEEQDIFLSGKGMDSL